MNEHPEVIVGRPVPTNSRFELYMWLFMRFSGVILLFLAVGHLVIMHVINSIDDIDYAFVVQRWAGPFWRVYDGTLLVLAMVHGVNGMRTILEDYIRPGTLRCWALGFLYVIGGVLLVLGLTALVIFKPQ